MKSIVKNIIELDQKAQSELLRLNQEKEELSLELNKKRMQMEVDFQHELNQIKAALQSDYTMKIKHAESVFAQKEAQMKRKIQQLFDVNEQKWLDEMFAQVKGKV